MIKAELMDRLRFRGDLRSHRIDRFLAAQYARDVVSAFCLQLLKCLDRIERGVRRENYVGTAEERGIRSQRFGRDNVERGAAEVAGIERGDQCRLIDQRSASCI